MAELLDKNRIASSLLQLQRSNPSWHIEQDSLKNAWVFKNFQQAFDFMSRIAGQAEAMDHHPDWSNVYNRVTVKLITHDAGGLTALDFELAAAMQKTAADLMGLDGPGGSKPLTADDGNGLLQKWVKAFNNEDLQNIVECYARDAMLWGTDATRLIQGHQGVAQYFQTVFESGRKVRVSIVDRQSVCAVHCCIDHGSYCFRLTSQTGPLTLTARFSFIWQRKPQGWQIQSHHSSVMPTAV